MNKEIPKGVIIFGGSGFIGTHLIDKLLIQGCTTIISVDIKEPKSPRKGVNYIVADVRDLSSLELFNNIDKIYNFAAIHTTPGHEHHEYYETNICGALEVCKYAERAGIKNIIFTSSISVYGPGEDQKTEETELQPTSSYGYSKMIAEKVHKEWLNKNSAINKLVIVRPAVVFGPGEGGNFTRLATLLSKGFFIYPGRKNTIKACIYVDDLIEAISFAEDQRQTLITFNGAYHQGYTLEDIIDIFQANHFSDVKTVMLPKFIVLGVAKTLRLFNAFNIGIHPERVMKLVKSTDVYPGWLVSKGKKFDGGVEVALSKWSSSTDGKFN
ncbi:hypothetical protein PAT01_00250 [Pseudoalteromonas atlantica]|uniref:NAD-dependent epimerase/dehydratase domain-containing protein n=1 Tax=Pseudoalteromonas atlantica TaxID=288 RepID=A0ABQ0U976_PSEAF|nr:MULTISPECIES: NAD(P)-dependent oxidoreductase [unclassified Pseudoalteromonas]TMO03091.1 epimerase [Pseudoalteromonas sp. S327]TMO19108.1 epimerase [Pseudoalteromonas sp. S326]GEK74721.1 hypothetical protein PAT01_00250 [Pseudoalteromonas atlantica]